MSDTRCAVRVGTSFRRSRSRTDRVVPRLYRARCVPRSRIFARVMPRSPGPVVRPSRGRYPGSLRTVRTGPGGPAPGTSRSLFLPSVSVPAFRVRFASRCPLCLARGTGCRIGCKEGCRIGCGTGCRKVRTHGAGTDSRICEHLAVGTGSGRGPDRLLSTVACQRSVYLVGVSGGTGRCVLRSRHVTGSAVPGPVLPSPRSCPRADQVQYPVPVPRTPTNPGVRRTSDLGRTRARTWIRGSGTPGCRSGNPGCSRRTVYRVSRAPNRVPAASILVFGSARPLTRVSGLFAALPAVAGPCVLGPGAPYRFCVVGRPGPTGTRGPYFPAYRLPFPGPVLRCFRDASSCLSASGRLG